MPGKNGEDVVPSASPAQAPSDAVPAHIPPKPSGVPRVPIIVGGLVVLALGIGAFFLFGGGDDAPADGGGVPAAPSDATANPGAGGGDDPNRPDDGEASGNTRAEAPVPGGISPDLLGTFYLLGESETGEGDEYRGAGRINFAYEGDRIVGRVVKGATNTGINLWGQLSLCTGDRSFTEANLVGTVAFDLDATGQGRWHWFELVPGNGFQECVRDDAGRDVSVIFTESRANATGESLTGATNLHVMRRLEDGGAAGGDAGAATPATAVPRANNQLDRYELMVAVDATTSTGGGGLGGVRVTVLAAGLVFTETTRTAKSEFDFEAGRAYFRLPAGFYQIELQLTRTATAATIGA